MIIKITKKNTPITITRKNKLRKIFNRKEGTIYIGYDYNVNCIKKDEKIQDLHLFCISIVNDLLNDRFKTNEHGLMIYNHINSKELEICKEYISKLREEIFKSI